MTKAPSTRDYFAELYVAGILADEGWNVYFPKRDEGFDFIIVKKIKGSIIVRPVQVKGKYPQRVKTDKTVYGYVGRLTQLHDDMVLAIPFFPKNKKSDAPTCVAYMPHSQVRPHSKGFHCQPASFNGNKAVPRQHFKKYFDAAGIAAMESRDWGKDATDP